MEVQQFDEKVLLELVKDEAKKLKEHATEHERSHLNNFLSNTRSGCVYGQMTGYCHSKRAIELIHLCCDRVYLSDRNCVCDKPDLNGSPVGKTRTNDICEYYSPIEILLTRCCDFGTLFVDRNSHMLKVIDYLKGGAEELIFD